MRRVIAGQLAQARVGQGRVVSRGEGEPATPLNHLATFRPILLFKQIPCGKGGRRGTCAKVVAASRCGPIGGGLATQHQSQSQSQSQSQRQCSPPTHLGWSVIERLLLAWIERRHLSLFVVVAWESQSPLPPSAAADLQLPIVNWQLWIANYCDLYTPSWSANEHAVNWLTEITERETHKNALARDMRQQHTL